MELSLPLAVFTDNDEKMTEAWSLRRTVLWCSAVDVVISALFGGIYYAFGFSAIIIPLWSYGVYKYNERFTLIYGIYCILNMLLRVGVFVYYDWSVEGRETVGDFRELGIAVVTFVAMLMEVWIVSLVWRFWTVLRNISYERLGTLQNGWYPVRPWIVLLP